MTTTTKLFSTVQATTLTYRKRLEAATGTILPVEERPVRANVRSYRRHARRIVSARFAEILDGMADLAASGSLPHTKFLFELAGMKEEMRRQGQSKSEPSLLDMLLAEVKRYQQTPELTNGQSQGPEIDARKEAPIAE